MLHCTPYTDDLKPKATLHTRLRLNADCVLLSKHPHKCDLTMMQHT